MLIFLRGIPFLIHEALLNVRRHGLMNLAVISTIAVALSILGTFGVLAWHLHRVAQQLPRQFEAHAFLQPSLQRPQVEQLKTAVAALPGVRDVTIVWREDAWAKIKGRYSGLPSDLEGLQNPLGEKLEVEAVSPEKALGIAARIRGMAGVDKVNDGAAVLRKLIAVERFVRTGALVLAALLFLGTVALISNSIRITLFARRREIRVMQLVGATNAFIRLPFLLEGMLDGLAGAAVACGLLCGGYHTLTTRVLVHFPLVSEFRLGLDIPLSLACVAACGTFLGLFGSMVSIRRFLRI